MRSDRIKDLVRILRAGHAATQQEIVAALNQAGHDVTQATVSRDLQEVGAVKVRAGSSLEYRLPDEVPRTAGSDLMARNLRRTLQDFALDVRPASSIVVVITAPGHASAVARAIDLAGLEDVVGTVAGDDTIFVATPSEAAALSVVTSWTSVSQGSFTPTSVEGDNSR
ncbi:MAG: transcriptional regulator of arginine metabolism [Actinomycetota bacterium]|jgi:transcriptional regulator of arginine metabolism|nr:transcriptional regulator of arginine metabolism [Actinomycetota bacterium]